MEVRLGTNTHPRCELLLFSEGAGSHLEHVIRIDPPPFHPRAGHPDLPYAENRQTNVPQHSNPRESRAACSEPDDSRFLTSAVMDPPSDGRTAVGTQIASKRHLRDAPLIAMATSSSRKKVIRRIRHSRNFASNCLLARALTDRVRRGILMRDFRGSTCHALESMERRYPRD